MRITLKNGLKIALEEELKQKVEQKAKDDFKTKIEEINAKEREDALYKPPPKVVQAYRSVFGQFPRGLPPVYPPLSILSIHNS